MSLEFVPLHDTAQRPLSSLPCEDIGRRWPFVGEVQHCFCTYNFQKTDQYISCLSVLGVIFIFWFCFHFILSYKTRSYYVDRSVLGCSRPLLSCRMCQTMEMFSLSQCAQASISQVCLLGIQVIIGATEKLNFAFQLTLA